MSRESFERPKTPEKKRRESVFPEDPKEPQPVWARVDGDAFDEDWEATVYYSDESSQLFDVRRQLGHEGDTKAPLGKRLLDLPRTPPRVAAEKPVESPVTESSGLYDIWPEDPEAPQPVWAEWIPESDGVGVWVHYTDRSTRQFDGGSRGQWENDRQIPEGRRLRDLPKEPPQPIAEEKEPTA